MGGRKEVSIISHRPVTRSDLKEERSFFRGSVSNSFATQAVPFYKFCSSWTFSTGTARKEFLLFST